MSRIFFHLLNDQITQVYAWRRRLGDDLDVACRLAIRLALLVADEICLPTVDLVQSDTASRLHNELRSLADLGLIEFVGSTAEVEELLVRKQVHFHSTRIHPEWRSSEARSRIQRFAPYLRRRTINTTSSMKAQWIQAVEEVDGGSRADSRDGRFLVKQMTMMAAESGRPGRTLRRFEALPSDLGDHAFLTSVLGELRIVSQLPSNRGMSDSMDMALAYAWLRAHVEEYGPQYVCRGPLNMGDADCGLRFDVDVEPIDLARAWSRLALSESGRFIRYAETSDYLRGLAELRERWHEQTVSQLIETAHRHGRPRSRIRGEGMWFAAENGDLMTPSRYEAHRVFIGHGRSQAWREVKDFLAEDIGIPWEEFNRTSVVGRTAKERLEELLKECTFAVLILTAEDERASGDLAPRLNVVHEVGLFQGRLGFDRAIILREEGCAEFSNLSGVQEIRFTPGNVRGAFYDLGNVIRERLR